MEDLKCVYDGAQSFYGKAQIERGDNFLKLYSYDTLVCTLQSVKKRRWDEDGNEDFFYKYVYILNYDIPLKDLFSKTTLRHIKEFLRQYYNNIVWTKKDIIKYADNKMFE